MEVDVDLWKEKSSKQDSIYASTEFTSFRSHFWVIISAGKGPHFTQRWVPIGSPFWNVLAQPSPYLADPLPNAPTVLTLKFTKGAECRTPRSRMQHQCTCDSTRKASETSGVSPWSRASQSTAWQWCATLPPSRPWWRAWAASWLLMRPHLRSPSSSQSSPPKTCV